MNYYNFSGKIISNKPIVSIENRAFRYADSLFESMFYTNNKIINIDKHWQRLQNGLVALKMKQFILQSASKLEQQCIDLLHKNNIETAARLRLQIFRKDGGLYLPNSNETDYIIEVSPLTDKNYSLNTRGLEIGIARDVYKDASYLSQVKTSAKQEMVIAAIEAKENGWDDAILMNSKDLLVESTHSNLFIVKNNALITPALSDGPLNGIMRQSIFECATKLNIRIAEKSLITKDLQEADEIFLTNAIKGVQWVEKFETKRYNSIFSEKLVKSLNTYYIQ